MAFAVKRSASIASGRSGSFASVAPRLAPPSSRSHSTRVSKVTVRAAEFEGNPVRQTIAGIVTGIYKATAALGGTESGLSPMWAAVKKLDVSAVKDLAGKGADLNERDTNGDTALLYIARAGHYKYPPAEIPQAIISAGADMEAKDKNGMTALQVSLIAGWQNISELLLKNGADTSGVPAIKSRLTCPDCKRLVAKYSL